MATNPEVRSKANRRQFSAAEKARILAEYDQTESPLQRAALLRKEAIYSSHIANWRKAANAQADKPRGRRPNPDLAEIGRLKRENDRLSRRLEKADATIEVLGKVHALLQIAAGESASEEQQSRKSS
jgi:transposase-like protein